MVSGPAGTEGASRRGVASAAHHPAAPAARAGDVVSGGGQTLPGTVTVWDGFARFATTPVTEPPVPGAPARSLEERVGYYSQFVTVRTPAIDMLAKQVHTLMVLGRHQQVTARPSLIVTGPAGAGKTTALLQVGRACHLAHTRRQDTAAMTAGEQVPVAYVLVPPTASAKTLALESAATSASLWRAGCLRRQSSTASVTAMRRRVCGWY